jgi:hypothetical protein
MTIPAEPQTRVRHFDADPFAAIANIVMSAR